MWLHKVCIKFRKICTNVSSNIFSHHLLLELNYTCVRPLDVPLVTEALSGPPTLVFFSPLYSILDSFHCYDLRSLIVTSAVFNLLLILFGVYFHFRYYIFISRSLSPSYILYFSHYAFLCLLEREGYMHINDSCSKGPCLLILPSVTFLALSVLIDFSPGSGSYFSPSLFTR